MFEKSNQTIIQNGLTGTLIICVGKDKESFKDDKEFFAVFRAVRDNGPSAALLSALGLGHGRESAPVALGLSALHPNRSDEPPAVRLGRLMEIF